MKLTEGFLLEKIEEFTIEVENTRAYQIIFSCAQSVNVHDTQIFSICPKSNLKKYPWTL